MKKRVILSALISFLIPFLFFIFILYSPFRGVIYENFKAHAILIFIVFALAFYTSFVSCRSYKKTKENIFLITSLAFFIFGFVFFLHAVAMFSGDLFANQDFFDVTEHYGLFLGVLLFLILPWPLERFKEKIYENSNKIFLIVSAVLAIVFSVVILSPIFSEAFEKAEKFIIFLTGFIFLIAIVLLFKRYMENKNVFLAYVISSFSVFINTGIIPLFYVEGGTLWWYFHFVIIFGFLVILLGLLREITEEEGASLTT